MITGKITCPAPSFRAPPAGGSTGPRPPSRTRPDPQRPYKTPPRGGSPATRGGTPGAGRNRRGAVPAPPGGSPSASNRIKPVRVLVGAPFPFALPVLNVHNRVLGTSGASHHAIRRASLAKPRTVPVRLARKLLAQRSRASTIDFSLQHYLEIEISRLSQKVSISACIDFGTFHIVLSATLRAPAAGCERFGSDGMRTCSTNSSLDDGSAWWLPPQAIAGHLVEFYIRANAPSARLPPPSAAWC